MRDERMNAPAIILERSFYWDGRPRPEHDSACILRCPACDAERATWTHRPLVGDVAAECPECGHTTIAILP